MRLTARGYRDTLNFMKPKIAKGQTAHLSADSAEVYHAAGEIVQWAFTDGGRRWHTIFPGALFPKHRDNPLYIHRVVRLSCCEHPKYTGTRKPRVPCDACWKFFIEKAQLVENAQ